MSSSASKNLPQPLSLSSEGIDCRTNRIQLGYDMPREESETHYLVECVDGLHRGHWIVWSKSGKLLAIGPESWCRRKIEAL